jgi:predicted patatin/cPLA2 family phospholipase
MNSSCIVLEGGGLRGGFTGGVLEYFLDEEINFDRVIGVSAGACTGASYISKQKGRNWKVNVEYPSDRRYMGLRHLLFSGSYFNMKFIFDEIPNRLVPFDEQAFFKNPVEFDIVITSMSTGQAVVLSKSDIANIGVSKALIATSSIPFLSQPVDIGGAFFFDGGVSDSIPVKYALSKHKRAVVILTRPRGYRKGEMGAKLLFKLAFRKHPEFLETLLKRNEEYNKTLDFCDQMEREGKLFVIAPSPEFSIGRTEKSFEKRLGLYNHGYKLISNGIENLQQFLDMEVPNGDSIK